MQFKKIFIFFFLMLFTIEVNASEPRSIGKYKNWESFSLNTDKGKICFAQAIPAKRAPSSIKRDQSRLFVTFRSAEGIKDEVSVTSGHTYLTSSVYARSGKNKYEFFSKNNFAWLMDEKEEQKFIRLMKKATNLIVKAKTVKGGETTDHYSMMGFTKAYNTAKKSCG
jgi:hypothetical protein